MEPLLVAAVLGVVEGLTEFLPISSTGHLILAGGLLGWHGDRAHVFDMVIQSGAMAAVMWVTRERLFATVSGLLRGDARALAFTRNLILAFLPAAVLGLAFGKTIKAALFSAVPVALAFILGGLAILWVEGRRARRPAEDPGELTSVDDISWQLALGIGLFQALALFPGTSRSAATIIGAMLLGLSRSAATSFSFFLAIPTLLAAAGYDMVKHRALFTVEDVPLFAVGIVTAFISALVCVRWLLRFVATHDLRPFAWYRLAFGAMVLATGLTGVVSWSAD